MYKRKEMKYIRERNDVAKKPVQPVQPPSLCWLMPSEDLDSFFSCIHRKRVGCCCCCYGRHLSRFFRFDKEINISYTKMSDVLKRISRSGVELLLQQWLAFPAHLKVNLHIGTNNGNDGGEIRLILFRNEQSINPLSPCFPSRYINNNSIICWVYFILIGNCVIKNRSVSKINTLSI